MTLSNPNPWLKLSCFLALLCGTASALPPNFVDEQMPLSWAQVTGITFAPDGRMFVWEKQGRVWNVENGVKAAAPLIDIGEEVANWGDYGLLGFAIDPDFYNNGYIYLLYAVDHYYLMNFGLPGYDPLQSTPFRDTMGRLTRYTCNAADGYRSVDYASRLILIGESIGTGFALLNDSHGVGTLLFGEDGTLLVSCGDGGSYTGPDTGGPVEQGSSNTGLADGIITSDLDVGAFRAQMIDSLNGKILRVDPATGNGVPSNPFYDPAQPRAFRSRMWALGLRNPFRIALRPGTGSHFPADADPGTIIIGDVGWDTRDEMSICTAGGQNFGWPLYEGLTASPDYPGILTANRKAPNPLYNTMVPGVGLCTQQFFYFQNLLVQDTLNTPSWPNPCDPNRQIPATTPRFLHRRPGFDCRRESSNGAARTGVYNAQGNATTINVGAAQSPLQGPQFFGNCNIGGVWYTGANFPAMYQNTYFHADWGGDGGQWIKNIVFDNNDRPTLIRDFADAGTVAPVCLAVHPVNGYLYYVHYNEFGDAEIHSIRYAGNLPPVVSASLAPSYGPAPLSVSFSSSGTYDPEGQPLTYDWDFGDGTAHSSQPNPTHIYGPGGTPTVPTKYTVTLKVTDNLSNQTTRLLTVSMNNTPPLATITSPLHPTSLPLTSQTLVPLTASISDAEQSAGQWTCQWQVLLHHNEHSHAQPVDANCTSEVLLQSLACGTDNYYYEVVLTVTDAGGLSTKRSSFVFPDCLGFRGDLDGDRDVDADDLALLAACATGPQVPDCNPACLRADLDGDCDSDMNDFGAWQVCVSGPGVLPGNACKE